MPLLDKHKVIMIAGGLATLTGLVIAWRSYEAQKAGNAAAADSADQQQQQDALLQQLMQPLSAGADTSGSASTVDTGSAGFDALLAELLGGGTTPPASGTGTTTPTAPPAGSTNPPSGSSGTVAPVATPLPVHVVLPSKFPQK